MPNFRVTLARKIEGSENPKSDQFDESDAFLISNFRASDEKIAGVKALDHFRDTFDWHPDWVVAGVEMVDDD